MTKEPSNSALTDYVAKFHTLQDEVRGAIRSGLPIVFQDETFFTKRTYLTTEYSRPYTNLTIDNATFNVPPVEASAFVCRDRGLLLWTPVPFAFSATMLLEQVMKVRRMLNNQPFALYLDRLPMHRSNWLRDELSKLNVTRILAVHASL